MAISCLNNTYDTVDNNFSLKNRLRMPAGLYEADLRPYVRLNPWDEV